MDEFDEFSAFLDIEAALRNGAIVEGPPAIGIPSDGAPVDMEYITGNSSSYSWCTIA